MHDLHVLRRVMKGTECRVSRRNCLLLALLHDLIDTLNGVLTLLLVRQVLPGLLDDGSEFMNFLSLARGFICDNISVANFETVNVTNELTGIELFGLHGLEGVPRVHPTRRGGLARKLQHASIYLGCCILWELAVELLR